jgi:hypothetical protein
MRREATKGWRAILTAAALVFFVTWSCLQSERSNVPPQSWWTERGPVVPHDQFPADCSLCHSGAGWNSIRADFEFDHMSATGKPLEGAHARAECLRCHNDRGPVDLFAARGCAGCHEDEHQGRMGSNCADCHDENDWKPDDTFARHAATRFPLIGAHAAAACWRCHEGASVGRFTPTSAECVLCHLGDLGRAQNPPHAAQGWIDRCDRCHIPTSWAGSGFNHPGFPLTGAHRAADCMSCHGEGMWSGLPTDCFSCHSAEYAATSDPNHVALSFPTSCERCHGTSTWEGARFEHTGITSGCVACHLDDYSATSEPNHSAASFPTQCELCHTTTRWQGADFPHAFPLDSGDHQTLSCADCHLAQVYTNFSCTHCHDHAREEMDDEHDDVSGYLWESRACYQCHPDGRR